MEERRRCEEEEEGMRGMEGRQEEREGVVISHNKFNLNPKLTRCCDCRALTENMKELRQHRERVKKKIKHRLLFPLSPRVSNRRHLSPSLTPTHKKGETLRKEVLKLR